MTVVPPNFISKLGRCGDRLGDSSDLWPTFRSLFKSYILFPSSIVKNDEARGAIIKSAVQYVSWNILAIMLDKFAIAD